MSDSMIKTGERIIPEHFLHSQEAYLLYLRHLFAYETVKEFISENTSVLEIGCGGGYGTSYLSEYVIQMRTLGFEIREFSRK